MPYTRWSLDARLDAIDVLTRVLDGVGDPRRERLFRLNVSLTLQRAISTQEAITLPDWFHATPARHAAGGPIEILSETELGDGSTRPCEAPTKHPIPGAFADADLWLPIDCGRCPPCLARATMAEGGDE